MKRSCSALLLAASVGSACAQSSVSVYGVLDAGVVKENGCAGGCTPKVGSGIGSESYLGISGSEQLTGTLSAVAAVEAEVKVDTGESARGGELFGRQAWVGLDGRFGRITLGRHYNLEYLALADVGDPFGGGTAGAATNLIGTGGRHVDNSIQYFSRERRGVSAAASYSRGDFEREVSGNRVWGLSVGFARGPLTLRAAHQTRNVARVRPSMHVGNYLGAKNSILAANLRVGPGTVYAAYSASRGWGSSPLWNPDNPYGASMASIASTDSRDVLVGIAVPRGPLTFLASYIRKDDRDLANRDANQVAVGATYAMSRRTDFYAAYSHIKNRNGAGYLVGNASGPGAGSSAINLGMRHAF